MEDWISMPLSNGIGVVGVIVVIGFAVMKGLLIPGKWHREAMARCDQLIERAEQRADRWEAVALQALHATERLTEPVSVAAKVITKLPNTTQEEGGFPCDDA